MNSEFSINRVTVYSSKKYVNKKYFFKNKSFKFVVPKINPISTMKIIKNHEIKIKDYNKENKNENEENSYETIEKFGKENQKSFCSISTDRSNSKEKMSNEKGTIIQRNKNCSFSIIYKMCNPENIPIPKIIDISIQPK